MMAAIVARSARSVPLKLTVARTHPPDFRILSLPSLRSSAVEAVVTAVEYALHSLLLLRSLRLARPNVDVASDRAAAAVRL